MTAKNKMTKEHWSAIAMLLVAAIFGGYVFFWASEFVNQPTTNELSQPTKPKVPTYEEYVEAKKTLARAKRDLEIRDELIKGIMVMGIDGTRHLIENTSDEAWNYEKADYLRVLVLQRYFLGHRQVRQSFSLTPRACNSRSVRLR